MKSFYRYLIPSVIASVLLSTYALIDGIFIGQKIGDIGLSSINLAWPITSFIQCIGLALGLSAGIYISYMRGIKEYEKMAKMKLTVIIVILILSIIIGIILLLSCKQILILFGAEGQALTYAYDYIKIILLGSSFQMLGSALLPLLKNSGKVKTAAIASISSILTNLVLDYFFIYSLDYDLKGAALASVIAQGVAFLITIIAYRGEFHGISFSKEVFKELFFKALAPFLLNFSYSVIIIITNALCLHYSSIEAVASYTLLSYLLYIISAISTGISDSIQPLFSYHYALKDIKTNIKMLKKCLLISFSISVVTSLLFYLFRNNLADLYNLSATSRSLYYDGLIFYLIGFLFVSFIKVTSSYLYSIDDKIKSNILILLEPLVLTLLYGIICGEIFGISGIWISFLAIQITLFIISLTLLFLNTKQLKEKIS